MDTDKTNLLFESVTEQILRCAFEVCNTLGPGFLEKVYERALIRELAAAGLVCVSQAPLPVFYKGALVGDYFADILVEDLVLVELKCVDRLMGEHSAQCLNYLKASGKSICLLLNFQKPRLEFRRLVG
jgi:GxxExxY protein